MSKKVVVTGASGFLGSHVCEAFYEAGYDVHALVRPQSSRRWLEHDWLTVHEGELNDRQALSAILKDTYAVVHAAAALIGASEEELEYTNVRLTRIIVEEAIGAGVRRFVYVSSESAGGPSLTCVPRKESDPDNPLLQYGKSKKRAEEALVSFHDKIRIVNLRYVLIYGPRDKHLVRLFSLIDSPLVPLMGRKPLYLGFVYIRDAARAALAACERDVPSGSTYQISDGVPYTFDTVYDFIAAALGRKLRFFRIPLWLAVIAVELVTLGRKLEMAVSPESVKEFCHRFRLVSNRKAREELGWEPQVTIFEGIRETVEWYRREGLLKAPGKRAQ